MPTPESPNAPARRGLRTRCDRSTARASGCRPSRCRCGRPARCRSATPAATGCEPFVTVSGKPGARGDREAEPTSRRSPCRARGSSLPAVFADPCRSAARSCPTARRRASRRRTRGRSRHRCRSCSRGYALRRDHRAEASRLAARAVVSQVVRHRLAPGVVRRGTPDPGSEPLLERGLQAVVVGAAARRRGADRRDQRVEREQRTAIVHRSPASSIAPVPGSGWLPSTGVTRWSVSLPT